MRLEDIMPTDTAAYGAERLFVCGQSGSGKSTLIRRIIAALPPARDAKGKVHEWLVVVVDSKRDWEFRRLWDRKEKSVYAALPYTDLRVMPAGRFVYRPKAFPERNDDGARRIFRTALQRKYCVVVIDEGADFGGTAGIPELGKLIRQARSRHVIVIFGTQRPSGIVLLAITEANKLISFQLGSKDDYDRLVKWGDARFGLEPDGENDFNFYDRRKRRFVRVQQTEGAA